MTDDSVDAYPRWIVFLIVAVALVSSAMLGYTGRLGGKIRHPEFHAAEVSSPNAADAGADTDAVTDSEETEEEGGGGRGRGRNRGRR